MEAAKTGREGVSAMAFDLVVAAVFLAMIIAPAVLTMPADRDERDSL